MLELDPTDLARSPKRIKLSDANHNTTNDFDKTADLIAPKLKEENLYVPYRLRFELKGHDKGISSVKFSPDGTRIATASADSTIRIWNHGNAQLEQTLYGHVKGLSDVCWSANSEWLVSASDDCTIRIWNASKGRCVRVLRGHTNFVLCAEFNRAGNLVASGSFDESIKLWDTRAGDCLKTLPAHGDPVSSVKFNIDGTMLVSCSHDGLIRIWDTGAGQCLKTLVDQDSPPVSFVSFSPNGQYLLSCTLDSTIRLWNFVSSVPLKTYKGHLNTRFVINAEMSNDEIIVGGEDGRVIVWDTQSKKIQQIIEVSSEVVLAVSKYVTSGKRRALAVASLDHVLRLYEEESLHS